MDLEKSAVVPLPAGLEAYLNSRPGLWRFTEIEGERQGVIVVSGVPLLVGLRPIISSERTGPIKGTLIMGRVLNAAEIARIGTMTHLDVTMGILTASGLPDDFQQARNAVDEKTSLAITVPDEQKIRAYRQLADIEGRPALMLRVECRAESTGMA